MKSRELLLMRSLHRGRISVLYKTRFQYTRKHHRNIPARTSYKFYPKDSIGDLLGFNKITIYEEYNISPNPVDITSFDNTFIECDIARGMIYRGKQSNIIHNRTMTVNPGYKYVERFFGGVTWYMMESKDIISSACFKLKNENNQLVSFNGQSVTFRLSINEI